MMPDSVAQNHWYSAIHYANLTGHECLDAIRTGDQNLMQQAYQDQAAGQREIQAVVDRINVINATDK